MKEAIEQKRKQMAAHIDSGERRSVDDVRGLTFLVSMVTVLKCRRVDVVWRLIIGPAYALCTFR